MYDLRGAAIRPVLFDIHRNLSFFCKLKCFFSYRQLFNWNFYITIIEKYIISFRQRAHSLPTLVLPYDVIDDTR